MQTIRARIPIMRSESLTTVSQSPALTFRPADEFFDEPSSADAVLARPGTDSLHNSRQHRARRPSIAAMSRTCSFESRLGRYRNRRTTDSSVVPQRAFRCRRLRPIGRKFPEHAAKVSRPSPRHELLRESIAYAIRRRIVFRPRHSISGCGVTARDHARAANCEVPFRTIFLPCQ
jgi:hypothetical protein